MIHQEVKRKIALLQEYFEKVNKYLSVPIDEILANEEKRAAMERWFLLMVDEANDINAALIYQLGTDIPETAKEMFLKLPSLQIIDQDFANKIAESIWVRNELTHNYEKRQKSDQF